MGRSPCCAKVGLNKGSWTSAEDKILTDFIHLNGEGRWRSLPKRAGLKRCGKSCRLRWLNYLRPDIKRGNISDDEEDLIFRLHKLLGNRWSLIAGRLPGRTDNEIKNYWNTTLKKKAQDNHTVSFPKSRKHYKKKRDNSELSPNNVVESDATQNTKTTESSPTNSNAEETQPLVEPVITESPMPPLKDDIATLNFEPNIDPTDLCLNELLSSDLCGLFEPNMTSNPSPQTPIMEIQEENEFLSSDLCGLFEPNMTANPSPQRPIIEILEEIWNADMDPDLINAPTNDSECIEDWLI